MNVHPTGYTFPGAVQILLRKRQNSYGLIIQKACNHNRRVAKCISPFEMAGPDFRTDEMNGT